MLVLIILQVPDHRTVFETHGDTLLQKNQVGHILVDSLFLQIGTGTQGYSILFKNFLTMVFLRNMRKWFFQDHQWEDMQLAPFLPYLPIVL